MKTVLLTLLLTALLSATEIFSTQYDTQVDSELRRVLAEELPGLQIHNLRLAAITQRPIEGWRLEGITISRTAIWHPKGYVELMLTDGLSRRKLLYRYDLNASINALKAIHNIGIGTILQPDDVNETAVPLGELTLKPVDVTLLGKIRTRHYIRQGSVIDQAAVELVPDVPKGTEVTMILREAGVEVRLYATTLNDATIGGMVRVQTKERKIYNARLLNTKEVLLP